MTEDQINKLTQFVSKQLLDQWIKNGHSLTNKLIDDIEYKVSQIIGIDIEVWMYKYGLIQDRGVKASRIPFTGGGKSGKKTSLYIQGLMNYVAQRMNIARNTKKNKSIAFAIAYKHKKVGMQIRTKGKGTHWLDKAINLIERPISGELEKYINQNLELAVEKMVKDYRDI